MLATVAIRIRYATRYVSATESGSKESSATVADCSASQNEGIASVDTGCSVVADRCRVCSITLREDARK